MRKREPIEEPTAAEVRHVMRALGSRGGKRSAGKNLEAWRAKLTPEERRERARAAARMRGRGKRAT